jgi:hypothetical protein
MEAAISACVVNAPMLIAAPEVVIPFSSAIRPMSMSADGIASRSLSSGIKLCPPASSFDSGCSASSRCALAIESARKYSNEGAYMARSLVYDLVTW